MNQDIYVVIEHLRGQVSDISYVMLAAARVLAQGTSGDVVAVLLGHNAQGMASNMAASRVLYIDHPALVDFTSDAYQKVLTSLIDENKPRTVLFGSTSIGADMASAISAHLELPLVSSCRSVNADGKLISQICGGKIMAESDLANTTTLLTMIPGGYKPEDGQSAQSPQVTPMAAPVLENLRVTLTGYIEPEAGDVDISKEPILVAVGRGVQNQDNIELAQELADALGGVVCGSRPLIDQGWLATSRLVGKSGKHVKPKVYLAMGISGAPEHIEGMNDSNVIIAINTDPTAPIFNVAKYGATVDLLDLAPVLTEQVHQAKGG
jgi:electron transfer flavoprotein alpha subunit